MLRGRHAGLEVQAVDVLREELHRRGVRGDLGERVVRGVRPALRLDVRQPVLGQPEGVPPLARALEEGLALAPLHQRVLPDGVRLAAVRRDAAGLGDASAGQDDDLLAALDELGAVDHGGVRAVEELEVSGRAGVGRRRLAAGRELSVVDTRALGAARGQRRGWLRLLDNQRLRRLLRLLRVLLGLVRELLGIIRVFLGLTRVLLHVHFLRFVRQRHSLVGRRG